MARTYAFALVLALGLAGTLVGVAAAQQMGDGAPEDAPKRVERAARIVDALEAAKTRAEAAEVLEAAYIAQLAKALEDARAMTKPVTVPELTEAEKEALRKALGASDEGAGDEWDRRRDEWAERALAAAFEDAGLNEEEEIAATPVIQEWYAANLAARGERDSKKQSELKKNRDAELRKLLGRKKANKVINNLNSLGGWGRGR